jgi:alpha-1,3-fucosyltransferase
LSFENALCRDYATEKFFLPLIHDIVPVVYGGANYTALAPPHSFIDALRLTPRQLARYLHRVGSNETLYNEFFWWKDHYEVEAETYQMLLHAYCDLCKKLHEDDRPKTYPNITTLWNADAQCMAIDPWNIRSFVPSNLFL